MTPPKPHQWLAKPAVSITPRRQNTCCPAAAATGQHVQSRRSAAAAGASAGLADVAAAGRAHLDPAGEAERCVDRGVASDRRGTVEVATGLHLRVYRSLDLLGL